MEDDNINLVENKIIMNCSTEFLTFDKKNYPKQLEGNITKKEWETIAIEATRVIGTAYHLRKQQENVTIPKNMQLLFWIMLILSFIAFIFLIIYTKTESDTEPLFYIALVLIVLASAVVIYFMFYNYCRTLPKEEKLDYFIEIGMKDYIAEINKKFEGTAKFEYNPEKLRLECTLIK